MKQVIYTVGSNEKIARDVYRMTLRGDTSAITVPGQFINIKLDGFYLRRPISVCDLTDDTVTIVYKVVGKGTELMSRMVGGEKLDTLTGLGNGFDVEKSGDVPLLVGGGVGTPPMYLLAKRLIENGKKPLVILGFNSAEDVILEEEFKALGVEVAITTVDGSYGKKGFVTDTLSDFEYSYFYTCGPEPMLKALYKATVTEGELSFEERMGCGFGACVGCTCETKYGNKRICRDGPVLTKDEVIFDD